jgi:hypothetical protein
MWGDLNAVLELYLRSIKSGKFVVDEEHTGFGYGMDLLRRAGESRSGRRKSWDRYLTFGRVWWMRLRRGY